VASVHYVFDVINSSYFNNCRTTGHWHIGHCQRRKPCKSCFWNSAIQGPTLHIILPRALTGSALQNSLYLIACLQSSETRRGVPQYQQPHVLLLGGSKILEEMLPGFTDDCLAQGATIWDPMKNMVNVRSPSLTKSRLCMKGSAVVWWNLYPWFHPGVSLYAILVEAEF
jgi:hypothetical protein